MGVHAITDEGAREGSAFIEAHCRRVQVQDEAQLPSGAHMTTIHSAIDDAVGIHKMLTSIPRITGIEIDSKLQLCS